ncbi:MAG: T9SS type A sorting domain-containing protein [Bacteroidota bacterium]
MIRHKLLLGGLCLVLMSSTATIAQVHFTFTSNTGNNATVGIPTSANPNISGTALANGDEIGAFTPAGLCVGAVLWSGSNTAVTIWGDNDMTPAIDGIQAGEQIFYRVWDQSTNTEYSIVNVAYSQGNGTYSGNGIYVLSSLSAVAPPPTPTLSSPSNGATGVSITPTLSWNASTGAASYQLQVSTSSSFTTTVVNQSGITATSYAVSGLTNNTVYYWRVNATNAGGTSAYSTARNFTTIVAAPSTPTLSSPSTGATGVSITPTLSWNASTGAASYQLQVSTSSSFTTTIVNQSGITATFYAVSGLTNNTVYYWQVNATNAGGTSAYSSNWSFTTVVAAPSAPTLSSPSNGATGVSIAPTLSWNASTGATSYQLQVSTSSSFSTTVVNQSGITATSYAVSGLTNNTVYYWRVNATNAGGTSAYSTAWSFTTSMLHSIVLLQGWNMISTVVQPVDSTLSIMLAKIIPHMELMKNDLGQVFWPSDTINTIGNWNYRQGYQIYMLSADTLTVNGPESVPDATPLSLVQGVNLVPYLRHSLMRADSALASVQSSLLIAKNNAGQVYWPAYGINSIGSFKPGQGYQVQVTQAATLTYPANTSPAPPSLLTKSQAVACGTDLPVPQHYRPSVASTGTTGVLMVEASDLKNGDEIGVWTPSKMLVGSGVISQGKALITIWGDNRGTENIVDGAIEGENLSLTVWSSVNQTERPLTLSSVTDVICGARSTTSLRYKTDGVWIVRSTEQQELPRTFGLSQNYPNPFNPSSVIQYALPYDAWVTLEVFNILGQRVSVLVNRQEKAGNYKVVFENSGLGSGVYFYRLSAAGFSETRKMIIAR